VNPRAHDALDAQGSPHDVRRFLSYLMSPGDVHEVRIPKHGKYGFTASGYFQNSESLAEAIPEWDRRANLYITLNPVDPALLARAADRIVERATNTTADADVLRRRMLLFDVDAVRPSGISSTDEELAAAREVLSGVVEYLSAAGWPEPLTAMSGNGYYALYRIDLPNDPEATDLVQRVLRSLAERFDTERAKIDTTVSNASRIVGVVGTLKRKGDDLPDRPRRRSRLEHVPDDLQIVPQERLEAVAEYRDSERPALRLVAGGSRLVDILRDAGIEFREQPPDANGITWYHVRQCPWHDDGRPFECGVGQKLPDGPYAGHCFHPEGQGKGWRDWKPVLGLGPATRGPDGVGTPNGQRPEIVVSGRHRRDIVDDAWRALLAANDPVRFFRHGNSVVEIAKSDDGSAVIKHLGSTGLSGRLDRCADFIKITKYGAQPARPPRDVVEDMEALEIPLPQLRGMIASPVFTAEGVLDTTVGYQPATGLYYEPIGEPVPKVPSEPDATDLRAARLCLGEDLLGDFPWADEHASRANMIAALVTPMVRDLVSGPVPLFGLDAPKAGNGKGLLATCASIVTTGHDVSVMADTKSEEEFRKRVTTKLMEGAGVLLLDNVRRRLDSASLAALLTATVWSDRVLGSSRTVTLPVRALFLVTGNNLQFSDEITRRTVSVRIDAKADRPWEGRTYRHPDLPGWLRRHRHDVIWACLVLVQHWLARGRPDWSGAPMGSYESWCRVLGGILETAGIQGFLENRRELYSRGDADSEEWRAFTSAWWNEHRDSPVKVAELQSIAEETLVSWFDALKDGSSDKTIRTKLGKALATRRDTRFDTLFVRQASADGHTKTARWFVEPAGDEREVRPTPAATPHEIGPVSDSNAGVAVDAGMNSAFSARVDVEDVQSNSFAEGGKPTPQYPHPPHADSKSARNDAGDVREVGDIERSTPQCKRCPRVPEMPSSNLCDACRQDVLRSVMRGQE
jgi:hypothetical protein